MNTIADITNIFDISESDLPESGELLIDLENDWHDGDSYQIVVNGMVREIEFNKVSQCGLVLFVDSSSKQITVVSLLHNKSSNKYHYQGKILFLYSNGRNECRVTEFENNHKIKYVFKKSKTKKKEAVLIEKEFSNNDKDRKVVEQLFEESLKEL